MNLREQTVRALAWEAAKFWVGRLIPLGVFLILARLLVPEDFGLVALAGAYIAFIEIFLEQGFAAAIVQRKDLEEEHLDSAFWTTLGIGLILTVVGLSTAGLAARLFEEPDLLPIVQVLAFTFLILSLHNVQAAVLRRELDFKSLAIRSMIATAAGGLIGIGMAFAGLGAWSLVGQQLVTNGVKVALLWKVSSWRPRWRFSFRHAQELFAFGINVTGMRILRYGSRRADQFLIGYFLNAVVLGYYTVAMKLYDLFTQLFTQTMANVMFPSLSRVQDDPEKLRRGLYTAIQMASLLAFPAFAGLALLAPDLVPALFGSKWEPSVPLMQVLALLGLLEATTFATFPLLMAAGYPSWHLALMFAHSVTNVVAFLVAVRHGIFAVALAFTVRGYLLAPLEVWTIKRAVGIHVPTYLRQFRTPFLATASMVAVVWLERELIASTHWTALVAYILTGVGVYGLAVFLIEPNLPRRAWGMVRMGIPALGKAGRAHPDLSEPAGAP